MPELIVVVFFVFLVTPKTNAAQHSNDEYEAHVRLLTWMKWQTVETKVMLQLNLLLGRTCSCSKHAYEVVYDILFQLSRIDYATWLNAGYL